MGLFSSKSKSSSTATTNNADNRGVADARANLATGGSTAVRDQATNQPISISSGKYTTANVKVVNNTSDYGAIKEAFNFSGETNKNALKFASDNNKFALDFVDDAQDNANATVKNALGVAEGIFNKSTQAVDKAYAEAKGGASVLQNVAIGAVLAAVAVVYFITRGKNA